MREKARQQGVHCTYRTPPKDILEAVARKRRHMRQGGWFHWRPDREGKLQPVSEQSWAAGLDECNAKLSSSHLAGRSSWVEGGQVKPFEPEELESSARGSALAMEAIL